MPCGTLQFAAVYAPNAVRMDDGGVHDNGLTNTAGAATTERLQVRAQPHVQAVELQVTIRAICSMTSGRLVQHVVRDQSTFPDSSQPRSVT